MPHIDGDTVDRLITLINKNEVTPKGVYTFFYLANLYLSEKQLRSIQEGCSEHYSYYVKWCGYDHALCSRVTDPWNLTQNGAERYYFCSKDYAKENSLPPHEWMPMNRFE